MVELVTKLKILRNPNKKPAKELLKDLASKKGYACSIKNHGGDITLRIDKDQVPMSLNGKNRTYGK